jgi:hypothetical protein
MVNYSCAAKHRASAAPPATAATAAAAPPRAAHGNDDDDVVIIDPPSKTNERGRLQQKLTMQYVSVRTSWTCTSLHLLASKLTMPQGE